MKIKQNLITKLKSLLFNNTASNIAGGEEVRHLFNKFHEAVFKVGNQVFPLSLKLL